MADLTKWKRLDFGEPQGVPGACEKAIEETNQDLQKPIQQLVCDVHELAKSDGSADRKQVWMMTRMVAMMGRVALEHERNHAWLVWLTWVLAILTLGILGLTIILVNLTYRLLGHPG